MKCALCEKRIGMFEESKDYPVVIEFDEHFQVRCHNPYQSPFLSVPHLCLLLCLVQ